MNRTPRRLLPHCVLVEPIQDEEVHDLHVIGERHVQSGWVRQVGPDLEEDLNEGDLVVFVGWKQFGIPTRAYAPWVENLYMLHEDDIELVIEEWD